MVRIRLLILICLIAPAALWSQNGAPPGAGARGSAMGQSGLTFTDIQSIFSNQAGLAWLPAWAATVSGEQRFLLQEIRSVAAAAAVPTSSGTFGLQLHYFGFEAYREQKIGLAYARQLLDHFSVGAQFNYLQTRIEEYGSKGVLTFELGLQARVHPSLQLGAHLVSPARVEVAEGEPLPTILRLGFAYLPSEQLQLLAEVEKDLDFPIRFRSGIEYKLLPALALRAGIATAPALATFGIGLRLPKNLQIDLASQYHQILGWTPAFSLSYQPNSPE